MIIACEISYDSAHNLPNVPPGHKCARLHGHTYILSLAVEGKVDEHTGWVIDFADIKAAVEPIIELLDHRYLNQVPGLANPTVEVQLQWLWDRLSPLLPLAELRLREGLHNEGRLVR